ncbi:WD repeat-containing protein 1-like [Dendronephthya gigantea]|uniref:WD repeat-containing protein 1-like n=1 Tax=Dendronephthya gigantea TaxID=151771 RepID=UPI00106CAC36|nr:WD repeat-containing protein 1-like [Dendronephthya gigantea]
MSYSLKHTFAALPRTQRGRRLCIKGDPKGKYILYSFNKGVIIRDVENPMNADVYSEHAHEVSSACYAPSGFYICSGDVSGKVRIWDTTQAEHPLKADYQPLGGAIKDIAWSPDSKRIVVGGEGRGLFAHAFLADTGSSVGQMMGHSKTVNTVDYKSSRPFRVISASEDFSSGFYEGPPFKLKFTNKEHSNFVNVGRFSPNGERYVTGCSSGKLYIYDGKTGEHTGEIGSPAHKGGIYDVSWCSDNKHLLTASGDKTAKIFDVDANTCVQEFTFGSDVLHQQLACLWMGDHLLTIELSGYINYLDRENPSQPKKVLKGHNKNITTFAVTEDKSHIYTASYDGQIYCWDVSNGMCEAISGKHHSNQVSKIAISGSNLYSISMDDSFRVTSTETNEYSGDSIAFDAQPINLAVGKDGLAMIICVDQTIVVTRNGKKVASKKFDFQPSAASIHPNQTEIAIGSQTKPELYVYSLDNDTIGELKKTVESLTREVSVLEYSPDGAFLGVGMAGKDVTAFKTADYSEASRAWSGHSGRITSLSWTSDSRHLASGSLDSNVFIWDTESIKKTVIKGAHRLSNVVGVQWLNDNQLTTTAADCSIKIWDIVHH